MKKRRIWTKIEKFIDTSHTIVLTGARRVGKTTTIKWILEKIANQNQYYFDLENIANRQLFEIENYDDILFKLSRLGLKFDQKVYIAIDEIQYVRNLPSVVKYLQDNYDIKFILSGSSSYYLKNLFSESLAGRKIIFEIFPLTFGEFLDFRDEQYKLPTNLEEIFSREIKFDDYSYNRLNELYQEYIQYGGLPQVAVTPTIEEKITLLNDIYSSYINLDVSSLSDFKSLDDFRNLVKILAARVGSKLNTSQIAKILGISRVTVESYIEFMQKTYLLRSAEAYSKSVDVASRKQEKIYFVDNGILNINADISSGAKFENTVSCQLAYEKQLNYFQKREMEVDFIVNSQFGFEVKETPTENDLSKMKTTIKDIGLEGSCLIGKNPNASFNDYLWGGLLG